MKRQLPIIIIFSVIWTIAVTIMAAAGLQTWKQERERSVVYDGCIPGEYGYLTENLKEEGLLYVTDSLGMVQAVTLTSSIQENSFFAGIDSINEEVYGLLACVGMEQEEPVTEYRIVHFDRLGTPIAGTAPIRVKDVERLSGFSAEYDGFYLTFVEEGGSSAAACYIEKSALREFAQEEKSLTAAAEPALEEEQEVLETEAEEWIAAQEGRLIVEARYEVDRFLVSREDGIGSEYFEKSAALTERFQTRVENLSWKHILKIFEARLLMIFAILLIGYLVAAGGTLLLQGRTYSFYIGLLLSGMAFLVLATGILIYRQGKEYRRQETEKGIVEVYLQLLAEDVEEEVLDGMDDNFYESTAYYELRSRLCEFAKNSTMTAILSDICLVRGEDGRILVSARGYNGQPLSRIYGDQAAEHNGMPVVIDGRTYGLHTVGVANDPESAYFLVGVARQAAEGNGNLVDYAVAAVVVYLILSVLLLAVVILKGWDLGQLTGAMREMAEGQRDVKKPPVYSRDVEAMWSSLLEIRNNIDRINYSRYQMYESFYRFAPKNIDQILRKDSITEVRNGDIIRLQATVATVSNRWKSEKDDQIGDKMDRFITLLDRHQEEKGGFYVSGSCGLGMLKLLFGQEVRNTVDFGVSFLQELWHMKEPEKLQTCILLHNSDYLYGVAGGGKQSIPYLISEETEELEKYSRWLRDKGVRLVVTQSVKEKEQLADSSLRYLGYSRMKQNGKQLHYYEVLEAYPLAERSRKAAAGQKFAKALELFYQHDFYLARNAFSEVRRENPTDEMARWYLFTCEKYLNEACPEDDVCMLQAERQE